MDHDKIRKGVRLLIEGMGDDPQRPGLVETPRRVAQLYEEIFSGIGKDPAELIKKVPNEEHDEIVLVRDIPFYSVCEHHLLPFLGQAHVAYLPKGNIVGLSKIARVVDMVAKRLQLQERLTTQVADTLMTTIKPLGVMVVIEAEHLCMTMRGIKAPGSRTVTSALRGTFRSDSSTRAEALALIQKKQ
ncbi:MAG: GTP cyclohydrolase I FolE [Planctomycetes bacterium]|nr:GTP cyclohydrolase I FolE [Planctomycetota bacterium]